MHVGSSMLSFIKKLLICISVVSFFWSCAEAPKAEHPDWPLFRLASDDLNDKVIVDMINDTIGVIYDQTGLNQEWFYAHCLDSSTLKARLERIAVTQCFSMSYGYVVYNFRTVGAFNAVALDVTWKDLAKGRFYTRDNDYDGIFNDRVDIFGFKMIKDGEPLHVYNDAPFTKIRVAPSFQRTYIYENTFDALDKCLRAGSTRVVKQWNCFSPHRSSGICPFPGYFYDKCVYFGLGRTVFVYVEPEK